MLGVIFTELDYLLRLIIAGVCGAAIGFERKNRLKEAGIRTHLIVAMASALMMIISKYGFFDVLLSDNMKLDPSRVASNIISGVGFLGAGMIFVRKQAISGLTTAAGIWATAGVGMAIGAGMYFMGITSTIIIFIVQIVLHKNLRWLKIPTFEHICLVIEENPDAVADLQKKFNAKQIDIINMKAERTANNCINAEFYVKLPQAYRTSDMMDLFKDDPHIKSIEL